TLAKASVVHRSRLAVAVPADLLDAVVQLVGMPVGVERVDVPVRARSVATNAAHLHAVIGEEVDGVTNFTQRGDLQGDLADGHIAAGLLSAREQPKRVVSAAVACEQATVTGLVRDHEAQQVDIKVCRSVEMLDVEAEMAEATDLEGPLEQDTADV